MRMSALMAAMAATVMVSAVQAATITVNLDHGTLIRNDGTVYVPESSPAVGGGFGGFNANAGLTFELPAIPAGEQIDSIVFHAGSSDSYWTFDTLKNLPSELFAMRISDSKDFVGSDYGSGASQPGTQISTGYFTGTTGALPDVDLTKWVGDGYVTDNFILLRMGTTADEATINSNNARWWIQASNATLAITTSTAVPEPTLLGLLGLSGLALVRRRQA